MRSARSGQLVHGEDATVRARHQAVVQRQFVGEVAPLGDLDRIDLTDEVGDRGVGSGEFLAVAAIAVHPVDRRGVTVFGHQVDRMTRDRMRTDRR